MLASEYKNLVKKKRKITNRPEQDLQIQCVSWFRIQYPRVLIHHSPNAAKRNRLAGFMNTRLGVVAGWPDLFIAHHRILSDNRHCGGLFVEMKAAKGKESDNQKSVNERLRDAGYLVKVIDNLETFKALVDVYLADVKNNLK